MKICLTNSYVYPSVIGGAEKYVYFLSRSLRKLGIEIVIISAKPNQDIAETYLGNIKFVFLKPLFRIGVNPVMPGLIKKIIQEGPDIVHAQSPTISADISQLSCKLSRTPIISTYHGNITISSVPYSLLKLYNIFHNKVTIKYCNQVITTTKRYKIMLLNMGIPGKQISVLPVGIEENFIEATISKKIKKQFERHIYKLGDMSDFKILFVGALDSYHLYKGVDNLLRAFRMVVNRYPDCMLIIVGDGDKRVYYENLCEKLDLHKNTIFTGFISRELLIAFYTFSSLFILPSTSISEGFGIVLLEAMSRGCPVITTKYAGGAEVVRQEDAGVVIDNADPLSISEAIIEVMENRELARNYGKNGQRIVRQKYTWEALSREMLEIYKRYVRK